MADKVKINGLNLVPALIFLPKYTNLQIYKKYTNIYIIYNIYIYIYHLLTSRSNMWHTVCEELDGVKKCAESNNLKLKTDKSKEMLVPKSGRWTVPEPPPLGMERVSELKILGVLFTNDLSVTSHLDDIISKCTSSTYALCILRANGLQDNTLFTVCNATTISRLLYAAPAWWGCASAADRER